MRLVDIKPSLLQLFTYSVVDINHLRSLLKPYMVHLWIMQKSAIQKFPRELWNAICRSFDFGDRLNAAHVFNHSLSAAEENHVQLWHSIFRKKAWLNYSISLHNASPVLLSPRLECYYSDTGSKEPVYMVLGVWDRSGDLNKHTHEFFDSLHKHTYDKSRHEVTFPCGIVLNVFDVIRSQEAIEVDPTRLFEGKEPEHLKTKYSLWNDGDCKLHAVESSDLTGPYDDRVLRPVLQANDPDFYCGVRIDSKDFAFCKAKDPKYWLEEDQHHARRRMRAIDNTQGNPLSP